MICIKRLGGVSQAHHAPASEFRDAAGYVERGGVCVGVGAKMEEELWGMGVGWDV